MLLENNLSSRMYLLRIIFQNYKYLFSILREISAITCTLFKKIHIYVDKIRIDRLKKKCIRKI